MEGRCAHIVQLDGLVVGPYGRGGLAGGVDRPLGHLGGGGGEQEEQGGQHCGGR